MKNRTIAAFCLLVFLALWSAQAGYSADTKVKIVNLSDHISRVTINYGLKPNIGVSAGPDGILLVDTGHAEVASDLLEALKKISESDIRYIINTHLHGDHAGGNTVCGRNATVINYENLEQMVSEKVLLKSQNIHYSLKFNGEEIKIIPSPGVHSNADLLIYFPDSGVIHMGDLLLTQSFPAVGPRVKEYLKILDKVIDAFPAETIFIGGHGRDYKKNEVEDYRKMLLDTIQIVREGIEAGMSREEMQQKNVLEAYESWGVFLPFLNTETWLKSVYGSYKELR